MWLLFEFYLSTDIDNIIYNIQHSNRNLSYKQSKESCNLVTFKFTYWHYILRK